MAKTWAITPEFEYVEELEFRTLRFEAESGHHQTRALRPRDKRLFRLRWNNAIQSEVEYAKSFVRERVGGAEEFSYAPQDPIPRPADVDTLGSVTSGSLLSRTYYVKITYINANGETTASEQSSAAIAANDVITVKAPRFPANVTKVGVYASETSGAETKQAEITTSGGTWQEPDTGLVSGSALPTSNTCDEVVLVTYAEDTLSFRKNTPVSYTMAIDFEESL